MEQEQKKIDTNKIDQYNVTGMSCAACSARVEKAVSEVEGVETVSVSLLTNSMAVTGTASPDKIIKAVKDAGYGATQIDAENRNDEDLLKDTETPKLLRRLILSVIFVLILMYFSMGHMMFGWPLPSFMVGDHLMMGIVQLVLCVIVMVINRNFFINGAKGIIHGTPNMDTLVALGSTASFVYSTALLFNIKDEMPDFYFESAAMILALITVGKTLEAKSKGRTTDALKSLVRLKPKTATVLIETEGQEENKKVTEKTINASEVQIDQLFIVKPGESIPVDGIILEGETSIDESALTGESIPVDKKPGDKVSAATINTQGNITCKATRVGNDTTLAQIIKMVEDASATKAPIAKVADKVSGVFVPVVIAIAIVTTIIWLFLKPEDQSIGYALARGISVLVISCPCALGLATPVAIMVGNGMGAKNGILFKTAECLENSGRTEIVVLDKTGTITKGNPEVTDVIPNEKYKIGEEELLQIAYSIEKKSEHPLAKAVVNYAETNGVKRKTFTDFQNLPGNGLKAIYHEATNNVSKKFSIHAGSLKYMETVVKIPPEFIEQADELSKQGKTPLFFSKGNTLLGIIAVADTLKDDAVEAIEQLQDLGLEVVMLTGDNECTARAIAKKAGIKNVIANVLPNEKESKIRELQEKGKVLMVGDGINDAPALTRADTGMAIGAGTDVAIDAADIVLMNSNLIDVPAAIRLSRMTLKDIHENLFWAFIYNTLGIPLAAGVFIPLGLTLNPMFGAAAMSLSSFCVVTNALRLNLKNIYKHKTKK